MVVNMPLLAAILPLNELDVANMLAIMLLPVMLPVTLTKVPVRLGTLTIVVAITLLAIALPVALSVVEATILAPVILPPDPEVVMFPLVILPVTDNNPVMYSPVVANTATLLVPPIPIATLPPELTTVTLLVPLLMLDTEVITPLRNAPLPKM